MFPNTEAEIVGAGLSDHCPLVVTINWQRRKGCKPFKFFDYWMMNGTFKQVVQESWRKDSRGTDMYEVYTKLKRLKPDLNKKLNQKHYNGISERVLIAKQELDDIQKEIQNGATDEHQRNKEAECKGKCADLRRAEEAFYKQKSRVKWLAYGDQNTELFF